jgi:hypothetical protein
MLITVSASLTIKPSKQFYVGSRPDSVADHVGWALFSSGSLCSLLPLTFRQLVKRRIEAFLLVLVQRDFELLPIVVSDPDGIVSDPAVHNPANAL